MKILTMFVTMALLLVGGSVCAEELGTSSSAASGDLAPLIAADFNSGDKPNNIKGDFGSWNYAPLDETQGCWDSFEPTDHAGNKDGYCVAIEYDVKSPNPAFCGFWMKLGASDVSQYDTLSFWVKGDGEKGFTSRFKVELKNKQGARAIFTVDGVNETWQEFNIPMKRARSIKNWTKMDEFTMVFDDMVATKKVGKIYLDQVSFKKLNTEPPSSQESSQAAA